MSTYLLDQLKNLEGRAERKFFCPDNHLVRQFSFFFSSVFIILPITNIIIRIQYTASEW